MSRMRSSREKLQGGRRRGPRMSLEKPYYLMAEEDKPQEKLRRD